MKELAGKRFGSLTLIRRHGLCRDRKHRKWLLKCDCGKNTVKAASNVRCGHTTTCGPHCSSKPFNFDITGQRFGKLVAIKPARRDSESNQRWHYRCDCGRTAILKRSMVTIGEHISCGCVRRPPLAGERFGKLTVLSAAGTSDQGVLWKCLCGCGETHVVRTNLLRSGQTTSCGCARTGNGFRRTRIEPGERFGLLVALEKSEPGPQGARWACQCDCGSTSVARAKDLRFGTTKSCGCLKRTASHRRSAAIREEAAAQA